MRYSLSAMLVVLCLIAFSIQAQAAPKDKTKSPQQVQKERLVLMPLRLGEADQQLQGAMEMALVKGLQQKYEVFFGEQVAKKAREIFMKESRNTAKKECDETRCLQGIAEAFQAELLATANITKQDGGYFIALSVQNLFDNKVVQSESVACKGCDAFAVIDKLKELVGTPAPVATAPAEETPPAKANLSDPEAVLWEEVKKGNAAEDYEAYLSQYPKGKFIALAKTKLVRLKEEARAAMAQQDQQAWNTAQQANTQESFASYLDAYPKGQFAALAQGRIDKIKREATAAEAKQKREAAEAAARGPQPGKVFKDCPDCPEMVMVPAGSFDMGSNNGDADEKPVHRVSVNAFLMGKTHLTKGQFAAFVNATGYDAGNKCWVFEGKWQERDGANWRNPGYAQEDNHPVACINWNDAKAYAEWLSRKTGKPYRLPTEAEWEYAARAGTTTARYWGESPDQACGYANVGDQTTKNQISGWSYEVHNCADGFAYTAPVASFKPNAFGLYDMQGNLWQWVAGSYHDSYNGAPSDGTEWQGDGAKRALRGGSWSNEPQDVRSAARDSNEAASRDYDYGFRLARTLP